MSKPTNFAQAYRSNQEKWKKTLIDLGKKTTEQRVLREKIQQKAEGRKKEG